MKRTWLALVSVLLLSIGPSAQPSEYNVIANWMKLPAGWVLGTPMSSPTAAERAALAARKEPVNPGFLGFVGVAVDKDDRVYAYHRGQQEPSSVSGEHPIVMFDSAGHFLMSGGDSIPGGLDFPHYLNVDRDNFLWIVDRNHHRVLKLSQKLDRVLLQLGTTGVSGEDATHFNRPADVAWTKSGDILVTDGYVNSRVAKFSSDGKFLMSWGKKGTGDGEFDLPYSIAVDSADRVYVVDRGNKRVEIFDTQGKFLGKWTTGLGSPWGFALRRDGGSDGFAYLTEHDQEQILKVSLADGRVVARWGGPGREPGQFDWANDIAVDSHGAVYVSDTYGQRVQKFAKAGS